MFDYEKITEHYGYSNNFDNCSYILKNGKTLRYWKEVGNLIEHYQVEKFSKFEKCKCVEVCEKPQCQDKPNCRYSIRNYFMAAGNIRCRSDVGMFHIICGNINWSALTNYIEHHIFFNDFDVECDYQQFLVKDGHIVLGSINNKVFDKDNYQEQINLLKRFYE